MSVVATPATTRSVKATESLREMAGWQHVKMRRSRSSGISKSRRRTNGDSVSYSESHEELSGGSVSDNWSNASGITEGDAEGFSISPLARHRIEIEEEPQLRNSIEIQTHQLLTELSTLGVAQCLFRNDETGETINLDIARVEDAFPTTASYYRAIDAIRNRIREIHKDQYGEPDLSPQAEEVRIDAFLQRLRDQRTKLITQSETEVVVPVNNVGKSKDFFG